jgi:hypothetical protein
LEGYRAEFVFGLCCSFFEADAVGDDFYLPDEVQY